MASFTGSKIFAINKTRPAEEQITAAALAELLTTSQSQLTRFEIRQALPCNLKAAADETSAKIESVQNKSDEKSQEAQNSIMEKINELKAKIAKWQASDNAESSEIQKAIADAKASIEKLMTQLKALQGK